MSPQAGYSSFLPQKDSDRGLEWLLDLATLRAEKGVGGPAEAMIQSGSASYSMDISSMKVANLQMQRHIAELEESLSRCDETFITRITIAELEIKDRDQKLEKLHDELRVMHTYIERNYGKAVVNQMLMDVRKELETKYQLALLESQKYSGQQSRDAMFAQVEANMLKYYFFGVTSKENADLD